MEASKTLRLIGADVIDLSTEREKRKKSCPYCQQPGNHVRFEQCLDAINKKGGDRHV